MIGLRSRPSVRGRRALMLTVALFTLASCGQESTGLPAGQGHVQHLKLTPFDAPPDSKPVTVAEFIPKKNDPRWGATGTKRGEFIKVVAGPDAADRLPANRIPAMVAEGSEPLTVTFKESIDPGSFNSVVVGVDTFGALPELLRVSILRDKQLVTHSRWIECSSTPVGPVHFLFPLPALRGQLKHINRIRIESKGLTTVMAVTSMAILRNPLENFAPSTTAGAAMLSLGSEARAGWPVATHKPLTTTFTAPERARLRFSLAMIPILRRPNQGPSVAVHVRSQGMEPLIERYSLENRMQAPLTWHNQFLDLAGYAGREVRVEFRMLVHPECKDEGWAFVAEPLVSVQGQDAPTVFLITSDTHRADHMGSGSLVQTPNLDALAARGILFEDALTATNVTNPSHVSLMTGLTPRETRILNNHSPLLPKAETLAERFNEAGYRCFAAASAFHLQHTESGLGQGFDRLDAPVRNQRPGGIAAERLSHWLAEAEGEPVFVWLHVFDAHSPYEPPAPFNTRYWPEGKDAFDPALPLGYPASVTPPSRLSNLRDPAYARAQYRAGVDYVDQTVGQMLSIPRMEEALIAFTADHGECFGEHDVWFDHAELYPPSVHVPLILAGPGVAQGKIFSGASRQYDVAHTLLAAAGIGTAGFPGQDLRGLLEKPDKGPRMLLAAHGMSAAISIGKWYFILQLKDHKEWSLKEWRTKHTFELFDLNADPGCLQDLSASQPERVKVLRKRVVQWLTSAPEDGLGSSQAITPEQAADLNALGYATGEEPEATLWFDPDCGCEHCAPFARAR